MALIIAAETAPPKDKRCALRYHPTFMSLISNPYPEEYFMRQKVIRSTAIALFFISASLAQTANAQMCEQTFFSCKIGGKQVTLCGAQLGDVFNITFYQGSNAVAEFTQGEKKLTIAEYAAGKMLLSSLYFKANNTTYAITKCDGMECNPDKDSWLSVVKGGKKVKGSGFCEPGSSSGFTDLPFAFDKKGNKIFDKKNFLADYFSMNKNPKEAFLTENISWSD